MIWTVASQNGQICCLHMVYSRSSAAILLRNEVNLLNRLINLPIKGGILPIHAYNLPIVCRNLPKTAHNLPFCHFLYKKGLS